MSRLTAEQLRTLVDILAPHLRTRDERDDALASAFHGLPTFDRISPDASNGRNYARRLLQELDGDTAMAYVQTDAGRRFSLDVYLTMFAEDNGGDVAAKLAPILRSLGALGAERLTRGDRPIHGVDPAPPDAAELEVMVREMRTLGPAHFDQGRRASRSVAFLEVTFPRSTGKGSGFLIADGLLLTCHHVLHDHDRGGVRAKAVRAWFDHEMGEDEQPHSPRIVTADVETIVGDRAFDWAVIRLTELLGPEYPPLPLSDHSVERGQRALIIHHVDGHTKSLDYGANPIWFVDERVVRYGLDTEKGSSGAPVFDDRFEVVALHYKGIKGKRRLDGQSFNEGINILRVREGLVRHGILPAHGHEAALVTGATDPTAGSELAVADSEARENDGAPPPDTIAPALRPIRDAVLLDGAAAAIAADDVNAAARHAPRDWTEYRLRRIAHWKQRKYDRSVDRRFTRLTLMLDQGEHAQGQRWTDRPNQYNDLRVVVEELEGRYGAFVVQGVPGVGKTTLLRRLELDWAVHALNGDAKAPLTFFVPLGEYRERDQTPRQWLGARWAAAYPDLPPLEDALIRQPVVLLLDALNELPHTGPEDFAARVEDWRNMLATLAEERPGVRCVFSCRSLDYSTSLSTDDAEVPHVRIERLDDDQAQAFLADHLPTEIPVDPVWRRLQAAPTLLDLCRTPYYLSLLAEQVEPGGALPQGRAALFTGFIRCALRREIEADHTRFKAGALLTAADVRRCTSSQSSAWANPHALPAEGALITALETLADAMQRIGGAESGGQVVVTYADAAGWLDPALADEALSAGADLDVLDIDEFKTTVRFAHQLMQEYFAARVMARQPAPALVRVPWRAGDVAEPLADTLARIAESDPLPPLPSTGWEETAVMAAEMMVGTDADAFVAALVEANLVVAARCAALPVVPIAATRRDAVRAAVARRMADPDADLRARIAAGLVLGTLGDPVDLGFERRTGPHGEFIMPPLVTIPAGSYPSGSDDHWPDERPAHRVALTKFVIGRYPVTNAEFALFVAAGGYADERWWETDDARAWLRGDPALIEATKAIRRAEWAEYPKDDAEFAEWCSVRPNMTLTSREWYDWFRKLSAEDLERQLERWYPSGERRTEPSLWNASAFNTPLQPVVGVSWYEAWAYVAWLSGQTGRSFALPSEIQIEAATRGSQGRTYAYGQDHDTARCNTFETHIRSTTPVGVFPGGATPEGVVDLTGNVIEWTRSLWGTDPKQPDAPYRYPYDPNDETREDPYAQAACLRVVRGGSWYFYHVNARAACRSWDPPNDRGNDVGFRLVVSSPISR